MRKPSRRPRLVVFGALLLAAPALAAPPKSAGAPPNEPRPLLGTPIPVAPAPSVQDVVHTPPPPPDAHRWTDAAPDAMIDDAAAHAVATSSEAEALAAIVTIHTLADRATYGRAQKALETIAASARPSVEAKAEAAVLARALAPDEGSDAGTSADDKLGIVTNLAILGPFRDTGGGLEAKEGPEAPGGSFSDMRAHYAWGTIDVAWRPVPPHFATARGVPLDVFVHPRKESCSLVATEVTLAGPRAVVVHLASTGSARLMFDGVAIGKSDDVSSLATLERIAARVDAPAGDHLVAAKVCTGALDDAGRVRLRLTDASGAPLVLPTSTTLHDPASSIAARVRVQKTTTTLGRALAGGEHGDTSAKLAAAVVRSLGGADDLKSPRAPGLLDAVTRDKSLDADRLAMAGWVAPSGANRSGWLNLALSRALASNDERTATFAARRIMAERIDAHLADWAIAARTPAKLDANDAEAVVLRALLEQALGTDALRTHALRSLAAAADRAGHSAPTALLRELGSAAAAFDAARQLAAYQELAARGDAQSDFVEAVEARDAAAVGSAAKAAFVTGGLEDSDDGVAVARSVARAGLHDAARALYSDLVLFAPNVPEAWAGLADEVAASKGKDDPLVAMALRRARELAPGEARYRAEIALRQSGGARTEDHDDERYLVSSETLLARRQGVPASGPPEVSKRELHWLRAVVMHSDRRVSQLMHYAWEIVIPPRTQDELIEDLPAEGDLTEILRARVHRRDGGTAFPTEEHNEGTRPRIRWPELEAGDTIEVAVRSWTSGAVGGRGDPPFFFLDPSGGPSTQPLLFNEVIVEAPPEHPIYFDVVHGAPDRREESNENGRHVTKLIWDKPPTFADEPLAPAESEIVPMTVGSTFKTWNDFRSWYEGAVQGFTTPDDEMRRLAQELTRGKASRDDKLRALFDFVADDIRYVNYTSGEGWLPNRPQQLLARREGDCDDKAILLITLLRAIGIDAQEVMVQTRETGQPSLMLAKNAAIPLFDHGIAFLPGPGGGTYLDATSPQSRLGPLPSMDADAVALRIDAGPAEIVHLPASSPEDHGSDVDWTITLRPDGSGDLAGEEKHTGDGAFWLRTYMTEEGTSRAQYVEDNLVGPWFPTIDVDKNVDFKGDLTHGRAWVRYRAHSDGLARHEESDLVVPLSPSGALAAQLAPLVRRTLPVSLPSQLAPSHQARTLRIVAPRGFRWGDLPAGGDENGGEFGRAHLAVERDARDPRALVVKRTVVFAEHLIPVDKYGAWRAWLQRVDTLMHKGVRLVREGGER